MRCAVTGRRFQQIEVAEKSLLRMSRSSDIRREFTVELWPLS